MFKPRALAMSFSFALLALYSAYIKHARGLRADVCHMWEAVIALITSATESENADSADKPFKFGWRMESNLADQKLKILLCLVTPSLHKYWAECSKVHLQKNIK